jgi:hypothetical protein
MMSELQRPLSDQLCPIPDQMLGEIYRASPHGLAALIATVSPEVRALLALYCFRRAHLASIGLTIATSCEKDDLAFVGGNAGVALFERSRQPPPPPSLADTGGTRRRISLSTGPLRDGASIDDIED